MVYLSYSLGNLNTCLSSNSKNFQDIHLLNNLISIFNFFSTHFLDMQSSFYI